MSDEIESDPMDIEPLEILYRDEYYIAINKPPRMLTHRSPLDWGETVFAVQTLRDQIGQRVFPVHRLDKPTSGLLVFGLSQESMTALKQAFEAKEIAKTYEAIVRGHTPDTGAIDHALRKLDDRDGNKKLEETQEAHTRFETLSRTELPYPTDRYDTSRYSHIRLFPSTGRRHQLRRHMVHLSHPIIGDTRHGDNKTNKRFREHHNASRLLLHATGLTFKHPISKETISLSAHLWPDFKGALESTYLSTSGL